MSRGTLRYAAALVGSAAMAAALAIAIAPAGAWRGAVAGAGIALAVQLVLVLRLGAWFPDRRVLTAGLAMLGRFVAFATVAVVLMLSPGLALPAPVVLLTLAAVFMAGALLEPLLQGSEPFLRS